MKTETQTMKSTFTMRVSTARAAHTAAHAAATAVIAAAYSADYTAHAACTPLIFDPTFENNARAAAYSAARAAAEAATITAADACTNSGIYTARAAAHAALRNR